MSCFMIFSCYLQEPCFILHNLQFTFPSEPSPNNFVKEEEENGRITSKEGESVSVSHTYQNSAHYLCPHHSFLTNRFCQRRGK